MGVFDAVYVINMDHQKGRWERVSARCQEIGVHAERFPGVNARDLTTEELNLVATKKCAATCTASMLGCALSHMRVWDLARKRKQKRILVLEDDAMFTPNFWDVVIPALDELPEDADIFLLGCSNLCTPGRKDEDIGNFLFRNVLPHVTPNPKTFRSQHVFVPEFPTGLHAYVVTERGLNTLATILPKVDDHIDWQISLQHAHINVYAIDPKVAFQESMLESSNAQYGFPGTLNVLLSKLKNKEGGELSYYFNVGFYRIGSLKRNVQINAWHMYLFICGILGIPWRLFLAFVIIDVALVPPAASYEDLAAKLCAYFMGLAARHSISTGVDAFAKK